MSSQHASQSGSQSVWTVYCGVNGEKHDCNIIKCPFCYAINPAVETTLEPTVETIIDLSNDTPTSSPSRAIFVPARGRRSSRGSSHGSSHRSSSRFNSYSQGGVTEQARQSSIQRSAVLKPDVIRATITFKLAKYTAFMEEGDLVTRDYTSYQLLQNLSLSFQNRPMAGPDALIREIISELKRPFTQEDTDELYLATSIKSDGPVDLPKSTANYTTTFEILHHFQGAKGDAQIWLILAREEKLEPAFVKNPVSVKKEKMDSLKGRKKAKPIKVKKEPLLKLEPEPEPHPDNLITRRKRSFSTLSQSDAASLSGLELPHPDNLLAVPARRTRRNHPIEG